MTNNIKYIWIVIVVIALIAGAYYFGTTSKNSTQPVENNQGTQTPVVAEEQPPVKQPVTQNIEIPKSTQKSMQPTVVTNSQSCLDIANNAAENDLGKYYKNVFVLQAHFKQSTGNCYYEMTGQHISEATNPNGNYYTVISYAPNDNIIAQCGNSISQPFTGNDAETTCLLNGSPSNVAMFHLIEAQYLEN